jgi:hypothetical protein
MYLRFHRLQSWMIVGMCFDGLTGIAVFRVAIFLAGVFYVVF